MKKQILTLLFVAAAGISSYAQCDKKIILSASSTEFLNSANEVQRTYDKSRIDVGRYQLFSKLGSRRLPFKTTFSIQAPIKFIVWTQQHPVTNSEWRQ